MNCPIVSVTVIDVQQKVFSIRNAFLSVIRNHEEVFEKKSYPIYLRPLHSTPVEG